jgi:hypothetical protein
MKLLQTINEIKERSGLFPLKEKSENWFWFSVNHQYPNKTNILTESLNYLFWKMPPPGETLKPSAEDDFRNDH